MNVTKSDAKIFTNDYMNYGNSTHFMLGGERIRGFVMTRRELRELIYVGNVSHNLFMMLALHPIASNPPVKHLDLIIGRIKGYTLSTDKFIKADSPYLGSISCSEGLLVESMFGERVSCAELMPLLNKFANDGCDDHLTATNGLKIKGYTFDLRDIRNAGLDAELDTSNGNDTYIFMPVIRPAYTPFDREYLSIAVGRINIGTGELLGSANAVAIEYCLPCPTACPNNFPIQ